ncbi:unnamed protein product [Chrysoparadoxa australica]
MAPIIVERGRQVESRGRDIGALFARKLLNEESNLCFGEGGAGTWSDGKLTTRIGRNSSEVREVLERLVAHGAPELILTAGKPHLGTDRLVKILRDLRLWLVEKGAVIKFGHKLVGINPVVDSSAEGSRCIESVKVEDTSSGEVEVVGCDMLVLAAGHSSRAIFSQLRDAGVALVPKGFAAGFRVEHPQELINQIRYGAWREHVMKGKGKVPVADYSLAATVSDGSGVQDPSLASTPGGQESQEGGSRPVYSFCMCPGGQIVPTSVDERELCVNGMSFSRRGSNWANSALVVSVTPEDTEELGGTDALRGVEWQRVIERRAAMAGGGSMVAPVQRVTDFLEGSPSLGALPTSSYRLGVKSARCDELYPPFVTEALKQALARFDQRLPGFISDQALLHGVETRTSCPVQIPRDPQTLESPTLHGLFPAGEGAGHAGGIVSAAVDGLRIGRAVTRAAS